MPYYNGQYGGRYRRNPGRWQGEQVKSTEPSAKQIEFLGNLMGEEAMREWIRATVPSKKEVSAKIDTILEARRAEMLSRPKAGPGMYEMDGEIFDVRVSKRTGNTYAMHLLRLPEGRIQWEYAPGVVFDLMKPELNAHPIPSEKVAEIVGTKKGRRS